jgi:hypothetical protein
LSLSCSLSCSEMTRWLRLPSHARKSRTIWFSSPSLEYLQPTAGQ